MLNSVMSDITVGIGVHRSWLYLCRLQVPFNGASGDDFIFNYVWLCFGPIRLYWFHHSQLVTWSRRQ